MYTSRAGNRTAILSVWITMTLFQRVTQPAPGIAARRGAGALTSHIRIISSGLSRDTAEIPLYSILDEDQLMRKVVSVVAPIIARFLLNQHNSFCSWMVDVRSFYEAEVQSVSKLCKEIYNLDCNFLLI